MTGSAKKCYSGLLFFVVLLPAYRVAQELHTYKRYFICPSTMRSQPVFLSVSALSKVLLLVWNDSTLIGLHSPYTPLLMLPTFLVNLFRLSAVRFAQVGSLRQFEEFVSISSEATKAL